MKRLLTLVGCLCLTAQAWGGRDVRVTVYNSNTGVVRDVREASFEKGLNEISVDEVAAGIDPTSVRVSIEGAGDVSVVEQNFEYDLVNPDKLLQKYLEEPISVATEDAKQYRGKLLGFDAANLVLDMDAGGVALVPRGKVADVVLPPGKKGLIVKPTLVWKVEASKAASADMEISYITAGMNWHAEYVAALSPDEKALGLASWVSIENNSGATYPGARLKLIAGEIHRAEEKMMMRPYQAEYLEAAPAPRLEEKAFFEYHMYTLDGTTTLKDREIKQIQLFPETQVSAAKQYNFDATKGEGVRVIMRFKNAREDGLGIPLPEGKVRVFKADTDGSLEFLGEDRIKHTPKDEEIKLYVGDAFDLVATRVRKTFDRISDRVFVESYEVDIRNHKDDDAGVTVTEHIYGDWSIKSSSHAYKKIKADEVEFDVPVEAGGKALLTYTVRRET